MRLPEGDLGRADAVHLPGAHAQRTAVPDGDDGVRLDVLDDMPAEIQVGHLCRGGFCLRHAHIGRDGFRRHVEILHQQAAVDADILLGIGVALLHIDLQQPQVFLRAEHFERPFVEFRRHDDLEEARFHQLGRLARYGAVRGDDPPEDRHLVGLISLRPGIHDILADGSTAGIHMFEPHAERLIELADDTQRGIGILDIVVRQLLAVELTGKSQRIRHLFLLTVELGRLVGVLPVAQRLHEVEFKEQLLVKPGLCTHIGRDHRIVLSRMGVCFGRKFQARSLFRIAAGTDFTEHLLIVRRVADHRDVGPVLGRRTQHRRAADVDVLDGVLHLHIGFGNGLAERVEVHTDHVDKFDIVIFQGFQVFGIVASRQQAAVHVGVQGLDAAVADLGKARHVADVDNLDPAVGEQFHRAARGDHLPAQGTQALGEINNTRFVADTD